PRSILNLISKYNLFGVIYDESIYDTNTNDKDTIKSLKIPYVSIGGYYHKYMKYKTKYLSLKKDKF
ncbi:unnamed protein product, partial [marine sediment metagenome]